MTGTVEREMCAGLLWKYVKERNYLKYLDIDERIILKSCYRSGIGEHELDSSVSGYGTALNCYEHGQRRLIT